MDDDGRPSGIVVHGCLSAVEIMIATARIVGKNVQVVVRSLEDVPTFVLRAAAIGMNRALLIVAGVAQKKYLTGPRPQKLGVRSGRLRGGVTTSVETRLSDGAIVGKIGDNVEYAAFHEFAFHGTMNISSHTRVLENIGTFGDDQDTRRAWKERPLEGEREGRFIGYRDTRKQASAQRGGAAGHFADTVQFVRAHTRNIEYDGRPYIRPALAENLQVIGNEVSKELKRAGKPK